MGAKTDVLLLAALLWQQLAPSLAQITGCSAQVVTRSCVQGDTPIKYRLTCTNYPAGLVAGTSITWTFSKAIFQASQTPSGSACLLTDNTAGAAHGAVFSCTTSNDGLSVSFAHTSGNNVNGPNLMFEIGYGTPTSGLGLQVLPAPGNVAISTVAHSAGATFTGPVVFFETIPTPLVRMTSSSRAVTTVPTEIRIDVVLPVQTLHIYFAARKTSDNTEPVNVFTIDNAHGTHTGLNIIDKSGATAPAVTALTSTTSQVHIEFSSLVAKGRSFEFRFTSPLPGPLPSTSGDITFNIWGDNTHSVNGAEFANAATGFGAIDVTGNMGGDPVTWLGNRRVEFKIPESKLTTMLAMPDLVVSASPFWGSVGEQWIHRIVVTSAKTQALVVQVDVEQDLSNFSRTLVAPNDFDSMWVLTPPDMVRGQPPHDSQLTHPEGFIMLMGKMPCKYEEHVPCREGLLIFSKFATIFIASSSASEYYGEHTVEALQHSHLDFDVFDMKEVETFQGVLPELWGFLPRSAETEAMLTPEELLLLTGGNASEALGANSSASVKSVEPKGICIGCSDSAAQDRWSLMGSGHTAEL